MLLAVAGLIMYGTALGISGFVGIILIVAGIEALIRGRLLPFLAAVVNTVFGLLVFYGFGLGLLGEVGVAASICLAVLFFAVQVLIARWWLARFTMGPLEWLWRALTYFTWRPAARG